MGVTAPVDFIHCVVFGMRAIFTLIRLNLKKLNKQIRSKYSTIRIFQSTVLSSGFI